MPSVVGLLEAREPGARRRVDELREEAERIQAELAVAEREQRQWAIARAKVGEVSALENGTEQDHTHVGQTVSAAEGRPGTGAQAPEAARPKTQVPMWREGLEWSVLSVDCQRILTVAAGRTRLGQGPVTCQEMAVELGMGIGPRKVTVIRSARRGAATASDATWQVVVVGSQTAGQRGSAWGTRPSEAHLDSGWEIQMSPSPLDAFGSRGV